LSGRFGTGVQLPSAPLLAAANSYGFARGVFIFSCEIWNESVVPKCEWL
jgi:hypothetical protein